MTQANSEALAYLRKESLDLYNRLHSIAEDIQFIQRVRNHYHSLPILPNLRCGSWYTDPAISEAIPAYFKSTDGHFNNWSFNLRRANLHLLPFILNHGGMILVDSTRAGKRIPDALSKTVPIWCAVINRAIFLRYPKDPRYHDQNPGNWDTTLFTPPASVSQQEHRQIVMRLDEWARALAESSFDLPPMSKPLRPFWVTPSTTAFPSVTISTGTVNLEGANGEIISPSLPIICVSASKQIVEGIERRTGGYTYIQGSGDDHELWGMGLDPQKFWEFKDELLSSDRTALFDLVKSIVSTPSHPHLPPVSKTIGETASATTSSPSIVLRPIARVNGRVLIASAHTTELLELVRFLYCDQQRPRDTIYVVTTSSSCNALGEDIAAWSSIETRDPNSDGDDSNLLLHTIPEGKKGQLCFLQETLPRSMSFIQSHLLRHRDTYSPLRICCVCDSKSGFDRSVGLALSTLQIFFDDDGSLKTMSNKCDMERGMLQCLNESRRDIYNKVTINKKSVQTRLEWIISSEPKANPSRNTLKRVNEYLMSPRSFRHVDQMAAVGRLSGGF